MPMVVALVMLRPLFMFMVMYHYQLTTLRNLEKVRVLALHVRLLKML